MNPKLKRILKNLIASIKKRFALIDHIFGKTLSEGEQVSEEYLEGIKTAITFSEPNALQANAQTIAESIPPDKPRTAFVKPDLFDDEIESLKFFDPETQRTTQNLTQFSVLPAKEFPLKEGRATFRDRYAESFPTANPKKNPVYQDVLDGIVSPGLEFYFPLFFSKEAMATQSTLMAYLPKNGIVITDKYLDEGLNSFWKDVVRRYEDRRHNVDHPILSPEEIFLPDRKSVV